MGVESYSTTAASNISVGGVSIAEGMQPSNVNDAMRAIMADLATDAQGGPRVAEVTVASASTCNILGAASPLIAISGTTTITSLGTGAKRVRYVRFTGILTLTHDGTSLILPNNGSNITTAAGDCMIVESDASSNARVISYTRANGSSVNSTALGLAPVGSIVAYGGTAAPSGWLLCYGQNVSRTTYALLFTAISTVGGIGDGSTTFGIPDLRGRVIAGQDDMGGSSANRLTGVTGGVDGDVLGGTGGEEAHAQTSGELATHSHTQNSHNHTQDAHQHTGIVLNTDGGTTGKVGAGNSDASQGTFATTNATATNQAATATNQNTGSGTAFNVVQPTIILNYIIYAGV